MLRAVTGKLKRRALASEVLHKGSALSEVMPDRGYDGQSHQQILLRLTQPINSIAKSRNSLSLLLLIAISSHYLLLSGSIDLKSCCKPTVVRNNGVTFALKLTTDLGHKPNQW